MQPHDLTDRERQVLDAVIQAYVDTAEPAGSRTIAKRFPLGISAATIRNTMSDLEDRGYLYHPHTSAGRIPTDLAYRVYVDDIMNAPRVTPSEYVALTTQIGGHPNALQTMLDRAAQVLGMVTKELGIAVAPSFDDAILDQLQMFPVSSERLLMVLVLRHGAARTIFLEIPSGLPPDAVDQVARVLNERLSGLTLREIRTTLRERLRDVSGANGERGLINVFLEESDQLFTGSDEAAPGLLLGSARILADQPEFRSEERMRDLMALTERRDVLREALRNRQSGPGVTITIGAENVDPQLANFTLVTSTYSAGTIHGVIGVMGPTRMSYEKVIALVEHTSRLIGDLL
jgi:heat-inducible transcriptional repressor